MALRRVPAEEFDLLLDSHGPFLITFLVASRDSVHHNKNETFVGKKTVHSTPGVGWGKRVAQAPRSRGHCEIRAKKASVH